MQISHTTRSSLKALGLAILAVSCLWPGHVAAQRWSVDAGLGPTLRVPRNGAGIRSGLFDSWTLRAGVDRHFGEVFAFRLEGSFTAGTASETIALGIPCSDQFPCESTGSIEVSGTMAHVGVAALWTPGRIRVGAGPGLYHGGDQDRTVLGVHAFADYLVLPWLGAGVGAARLGSDLGTIRWLVSPRVSLCLRRC